MSLMLSRLIKNSSYKSSRYFIAMALALVIFFGAVSLGKSSAVSIGRSQPRDGSKLVVSAAGSYYAPLSVSYIYVPSGSSSSFTINNIIGSQSGSQRGIEAITVHSVMDEPAGSCDDTGSVSGLVDTDGYNGAPIAQNGTSISINPNNNTRPIGSATPHGTKQSTGGDLDIYCIKVRTSSAMNTPGGSSGCGGSASCESKNISFTLLAASRASIGNYPGSNRTRGTGYVSNWANTAYDGNPNNDGFFEYSKNIEFSPDCKLSPGYAAGQVINLYDLDTKPGIQGADRDITVRLRQADRGAAASFGNASLVSPTPRTIGSDISLTLGGSSAGYTVEGIDTGESISIQPVGGFDKNKKYELVITDINRKNKVRIRIPFEQIDTNRACPSGDPTGNITLTCSANDASAVATIIVRRGDVTDPDDQVMTIDVDRAGRNSSPNTRTFRNSISSSSTLVSFTNVSRGSPHTIAGTITNASGAVLRVSRSITCPLPTTLSCPSYSPYEGFSTSLLSVNLPQNGKPNDSYSGAYNISRSFSTGWVDVSPTRQERRQNATANKIRTYASYIMVGDMTDVRSVVSEISGGTPSRVNIEYDEDGSSDGNVEINYTSLAERYPYDPATPRITYRWNYERFRQEILVSRSRNQFRTRSTPTSNWGPTQNTTSYGPWPNSGSTTGSVSSLGVRSTGDLTTSAPQLPPCYPRTFTATPTATSARLTPNTENPNEAEVNARIRFTFNYTRGGSLRTRSSVSDIGYTVDWRADGFNSPSGSGRFTGIAGATAPSTSNGSFRDVTLGREFIEVTIPILGVPGNPGADAILNVGDFICWTISVDDPTGDISLGGAIVSRPNTAPRTSTICTDPVINNPYFKVFESGTVAGGAFGTGLGSFACESGVLPRTGGGRALGFSSTDSSGDLIGASTQYALMALGQVDGIFSRGVVPSSDRTPLTFANTGVGSSFGGQLGESSCISNFWREAQELIDGSSDPFVNIPTASISSGESAVYIRPSSSEATTITGGAVTQSRNTFIDGNAYISGNITTPDSWTEPDDIVLNYITVKGDIFIDASVTRLDALIVAIPRDDGTRGRIYTCRSSATANGSGHPGFTACRQQLVINGGLVAAEVHMGRTGGSISRNSRAGELPSNTGAAEVIHVSPEYYVGLPPQSPIRSSLFSTDSVQNLPPVF